MHRSFVCIMTLFTIYFLHANNTEIEFFQHLSSEELNSFIVYTNLKDYGLSCLRHYVFDNISFVNINLAGSKLAGIRMNKAILRGACLQSSNLAGSYFIQCDFSGANFTKSKCFNSDFTGSTLVAVDLRDAKLAGSILSEANLSFSDLRGSSLHKVKLQGTTLLHCKITTEQLKDIDLDIVINNKMQVFDDQGCILDKAEIMECYKKQYPVRFAFQYST